MTTKPLISIIVPVPSGEKNNRLLESLKKMKYPKKKLELIFSIGKNPPKQRNEAIKMARGDFVYFVDNDATVNKHVFENLVKTLKQENTDAIGGNTLPPKDSTLLQKSFHFVLSNFLGTGKMRYRYKPKENLSEGREDNLILCNLGIKKNIIKKFMINDKLFNEDLFPNEENELLNRMKKSNCKILYNPNIIVFHEPRKNFVDFAKQIYNYGKGRIRYFFKKTEFFNPYFMIPSLFLIYLLFLPIFYSNIFFLVPILFYLLLIIFNGILFSVKNRNIVYLLTIPISFIILHVSYGLGFLTGFLKSDENSSRNNHIIVKKIKI
jgi:GT2 family glycosyltransferase